MIDVHCLVKIYEVNGEDCVFDDRTLGVESHWNNDDLVVVVMGSDKYTVNGRNLKTAIENAMHTARF